MMKSVKWYDKVGQYQLIYIKPVLPWSIKENKQHE